MRPPFLWCHRSRRSRTRAAAAAAVGGFFKGGVGGGGRRAPPPPPPACMPHMAAGAACHCPPESGHSCGAHHGGRCWWRSGWGGAALGLSMHAALLLAARWLAGAGKSPLRRVCVCQRQQPRACDPAAARRACGARAWQHSSRTRTLAHAPLLSPPLARLAAQTRPRPAPPIPAPPAAAAASPPHHPPSRWRPSPPASSGRSAVTGCC